MCIAAPAQVVEINREENWLFADFGGARQQAKMDLLPEVEIGDYVLIHAGYAIENFVREEIKTNNSIVALRSLGRTFRNS